MLKKKEIKQLVKCLEIPWLVHFTHINNLDSILKNGLFSRNRVDKLKNAKVNDNLRLDGRTDTISLSIAHPNDKMFYSIRDNNDDHWVVLGINKRVLWKRECLFFKHNAASSIVKELPETYLSSAEALSDMYKEIDSLPTRKEQKLKSFDPTDVQAEVLVKEYISPSEILGVVVSNRRLKKKVQKRYDNLDVKINQSNKGMYATRSYRRRYS